MIKNKGATLYNEGKKLILGGNMLFSKNPDQILPRQWPSYYSKCNGTFVWDTNDKKYLDMMCYVGQSTLGYCDPDVDRKIIETVKGGNICTLNSPEEVKLSIKLNEIHKWTEMSKFCKSGGEANAVAIRIARAATSKSHIAICGYHGWHDWYLSAAMNSGNNLDKHLMKNIKHDGVPKELKNTSHPFTYGNFYELEKITKKYDLAAVKLEVARSSSPDINFLKKVRDFTKRKKIVLIFDECTSGFRCNYGGLHLKTGVNPDLVMFGKTLGNGYPITAVSGKASIMKRAENSFISSTFWTDKIGYVAALETLKKMKKIKSWEKILLNSNYLEKKWLVLAKKYNLNISLSGFKAITSFIFKKDHSVLKTFISQEMLKKNILATNLVFLNIHHTKKIIDIYINELNKIFKVISQKDKSQIKSLMNGPICKAGFKRNN